MTVEAQELDLSAGQYVKGIQLDDSIFLAATNFNQLRSITRNPVLLQAGARRGALDEEELEYEVEIHEMIQRALAGNKKANVPKYSAYIGDVVRGKVGVLPPMHLWSEQELSVVAYGRQSYLLVPNGQHLLAIDGETQLAAHWQISGTAGVDAETRDAHRRYPPAAVVHHGVEVSAARQYFHDLNVLAVRPNTSLGLAMDTKDPLMKIVDEVEVSIPQLAGRVEKQKRQLLKSSGKIVTLQNLRQMIVNIAKGTSGVQFGSRPVPVDDIRLEDVRQVALDWIRRYFSAFEADIGDREDCLAGTGAVLAAVGAMANQLVDMPYTERAAAQDKLIMALREVNWRKGPHWTGIAGNITASGTFSVKGTKEVAYAIYNALVDPASQGYQRIRTHP